MKVRILNQYATFESMIGRRFIFPIVVASMVLGVSCGERSQKQEAPVLPDIEVSASKVRYAKSFYLETHKDYTVVHVTSPWPNAAKPFKYLIAPKENLAKMTFSVGTYDAIIGTPITSLVATSTTHIPALESLEGLNTLVGFPDTQYISSMPEYVLLM